MTKDEVKNLISIAAANYIHVQDKDLSGVVKIWTAYLAETETFIALAALQKIIATRQFFPTLSELLEEIRNIENNLAGGIPGVDEAWFEVIDHVRKDKNKDWSHPAIKQAVDTIGFLTICHSTEIGVERAHFFQVYKSIIGRFKNDQVNAQLKAVSKDIMDKMLFPEEKRARERLREKELKQLKA